MPSSSRLHMWKPVSSHVQIASPIHPPPDTLSSTATLSLFKAYSATELLLCRSCHVCDRIIIGHEPFGGHETDHPAVEMSKKLGDVLNA